VLWPSQRAVQLLRLFLAYPVNLQAKAQHLTHVRSSCSSSTRSTSLKGSHDLDIGATNLARDALPMSPIRSEPPTGRSRAEVR
jgi:hypothetical protein